MLNTIKNAWRIPDLRKKMLFTLFIIIAFRFGSVIPIPFLDMNSLQALMESASANTALGYINMLTGGAFQYASLFARGLSRAWPIISTCAVPAL